MGRRSKRIGGKLVCSVFFFSSRRRHTRYWRDWSSDVCSSDLLRRAEALAVAGRALRRQDLSERGIAERLARASVAPAAVEESLAVLSRAGLVDDSRFARTRATSLAERGYGDAAIRHDLERPGGE